MEVNSIDFIDITNSTGNEVPIIRKKEIDFARGIVIKEIDKNNTSSAKYNIEYAEGIEEEKGIYIYVIFTGDYESPESNPSRLYIIKNNEIAVICDSSNRIIYKK